jgi:glycosyltransferase involved in cell wall biosynthesis
VSGRPGPLRVVIVAEHASAIYGGEAILPLHIFRKLRARGVEAWLVVHSRTKAELLELMPEEADRISFIPDTNLHILMYRLGRFLPARLSYFTTGYVSRLSCQRLARRIVRGLIADHDVDLVHQPIPVSPREPSLMHGLGVPVVMGPMNGGMTYPPAFASSDRKVALVGSLAELGRKASGLVNRLMPGKLKAETLLVANRRTREALPSGIRGKVIELVENGVDPALWLDKAEPVPPRPTGDPVRFTFVGRLVDWKAVDLLLEAFARVVAEVPSTLEIIGDGPMRGSLEAQVDRLGLGGSVRFEGWLKQPECAGRLGVSDVLVLPSLYECGGAVVLEAMACGLPCVATNWGGPADYLDDSCGVLVAPDSRDSFVDGLAAAMLRLARSKELRDSMGRSALEKVATGPFNWDHKIERILEIYAETIDRAAPGSRGHDRAESAERSIGR